MGQRERGENQESDDSATPLVDATVRFLEEFVYEEKKFLPMQQQQQGSRGEAREEEKKEEEGEESFMPTYVYDAMKEKKRFDNMRVRTRDFLTYPFIPFYVDRSGNVFRVAIKKTRRNS